MNVQKVVPSAFEAYVQSKRNAAIRDTELDEKSMKFIIETIQKSIDKGDFEVEIHKYWMTTKVLEGLAERGYKVTGPFIDTFKIKWSQPPGMLMSSSVFAEAGFCRESHAPKTPRWGLPKMSQYVWNNFPWVFHVNASSITQARAVAKQLIQENIGDHSDAERLYQEYSIANEKAEPNNVSSGSQLVLYEFDRDYKKYDSDDIVEQLIECIDTNEPIVRQIPTGILIFY